MRGLDLISPSRGTQHHVCSSIVGMVDEARDVEHQHDIPHRIIRYAAEEVVEQPRAPTWSHGSAEDIKAHSRGIGAAAGRDRAAMKRLRGCRLAQAAYRFGVVDPDARTGDVPATSDRMGCAVLLAAAVGCVTMPIGGFLLLGWSALVSLVMVVGAHQSGRRVSRLAVMGLIVSIPVPFLLWGLLPVLAQSG